MNLIATAGSRIYIGAAPKTFGSVDWVAADFTAVSWTEITGVTDLGTLGDEASLITSNQVNVSRTRKLKGVNNAGSINLVMDLDYADPGQLALIAAQKVYASYPFRITFPDAPTLRSSTATITIAAPGVIGWTAHGLVVGQPISFATTGALPTGLTAATTYYVKTVLDASTFTVAATVGGAAITTTGSQSGVHTASTMPTPSSRYFTGLVMSQSEALGEANSQLKLQATVEIDSNVARVAALG